MRTVTLAFVAVATGLMAACSSTPPAAPPAPAPVSGIDLSTADKAIRPQDDLFHHVNGGWLASTEIPADRAAWGAFDMLAEKTREDLRAIAESAAKATDRAPGSDAQKIGDFYNSFMDEATVEARGLTPLKAQMDAIDALESKTDLARYFAEALKLNISNPIAGYVEGDAAEPNISIFYLFQSGLGLPDRDYYLKDDAKLKEYREKYKAFLTAILTQAGHASPEATADGIIALETRLARLHWTNVENRDAVKTYNKVATADLATQFPGFEWTPWLEALGLAGAPNIVVSQPSYLKGFAAMYAQMPVDQWKPYLKASLINSYAPYLSKAYADADFEFYSKTLRGVQVQQDRWKRAVSTLNGNLGEMVGKLYVDKHFKPEARARMQQLVENLRTAYRQSIDQLEWMSAETKKQAQEKLARFTPKVGYPNKWRDYSKVEVSRDDLVGNLQRAARAQSDFELAKVGKPVDPEDWGMTPQTVNAYYNPIRNEIVFPAAILQPPFFNMAADDAVNYGGIGAVIGHEMGHGFDDQGRNYDATGALRDWWTKDDAAEYKKRAQMVVDQYNALEVLPGLKVNGELTLGENLADLTGLIISYRAYELALAGAPAPTLDGLTGPQRFFMGWAQVWRTKMRDDSLRQQVMTDPHAPAQFRGNIPLRNAPAFYAAFDIKDSDKLFLPTEQRARIW